MNQMSEMRAARTRLVNRMRSAEGHMAAIAAMIEGDAPCAEILRQTMAVRGALRALSEELWRGYLLNGDCGLRARDESTRYRHGAKYKHWCARDNPEHCVSDPERVAES